MEKESELSQQSPMPQQAMLLLGMPKPIDQMTKEELKERLTLAVRLIGWLPDEIQFLLSKIGAQVAFVTTSGSPIYGDFMGFNCEIVEYKVDTTELVYDYRYGKNYYDTSRSILKKAYVTRIKWLDERAEKEEENKIV